ncbi:MAG TPA: hypothetical protein VLF66_10290, partial [Thermoanaerobaculia bacterium]|nr:hypothetical protein [Thermoanaerobaculia bacterium]
SMNGAEATSDLGLEIVEAGGTDQNNYPLTFTVYPRDEIVIELAAYRRWFDETTLDERLEELSSLLGRMAARPWERLGELLYWLAAERRRLRSRSAERRHAENLASLRRLRPGVLNLERG